MTKSIYDEVLDILTDSFQDPQDEDDDCYLLDRQQMNKIARATRQAQHQEELLGHYKDLAEVRKELYDLTINFKPSNKDRMTILFIRENLVSDIIKELENKDYIPLEDYIKLD